MLANWRKNIESKTGGTKSSGSRGAPRLIIKSMSSEGLLKLDFTVPVIELPDVNAIRYGKFMDESGQEKPLFEMEIIASDSSTQPYLDFDWYVAKMT